MKCLAGRVALGAVFALAAGCSAKPLQADGGGTGPGKIGIDGGVIGAGGAAGAAGAADGGTGAATDALFAGRRSYTVTGRFSAADGGATGGPTRHEFTMVVDGDARTAIIGANGTTVASPVEPLIGGFRIPAFGLPLPSSACSATVSYGDLTFNIDPEGGLTGSGSGRLTTVVTDVATIVAVTVSFTGAFDTIPPRLVLGFSSPFASPWIASSEPLPGTARAFLRGPRGQVIALSPSPTRSGFIDGFDAPTFLLPYGQEYLLDITGITDFAGNAAVPDVIDGFTSNSAPPLIAADGFESLQDGTLLGAKLVVAAAGEPAISGDRSLYIPPSGSLGSPTPTAVTMRLAVPAGSTAIRFSYRTVSPTSYTAASAYFAVASVGGTIVTMTPGPDDGPTTTGVIAGAQATLGPLLTATIALPADATNEIVFARYPPSIPCGLPSPAVEPGVIIDDLRAE